MNDNIQKLIAQFDIEDFWSQQQLAIFCWFAYGSGNLVARARAGTGKTTTIVRALDFAPEESILVCAFNKKIEIELTKRVRNANVLIKTLHALGLSVVRKVWERIQIEKRYGTRADGLTNRVCPSVTPDNVKRLVTKLHTKGREIAPHAKHLGDLTELLYKFECEPEEQWIKAGYGAEFVETMALEAMELAATQRPLEIDFADMIFLPIRNGWLKPTFDAVVVDEAQDMSAAQLELAQGVCKPTGRMALIGDDRQAIYDFRGADSTGLDRLKAELKAEELSLTTTYRCGKAIVADAKRLVSDFEAGENNPEGEILSLTYDKLTADAQNGNFILSRTNAPLVKTAMSLLRNQKRARIAGRDIGQGLKAIMRKINVTNSVPELLKKLEAWEKKEIDRALASKQEKRVEFIQDQAETIRVITDGATGVREVEARIDALFSDDGLGDANVITCSSVHRAKGLEAEKVYILTETLYPGRGAKMLKDKKPQTPAQLREEANIEYVAITRAKKTLVKVTGMK